MNIKIEETNFKNINSLVEAQHYWDKLKHLTWEMLNANFLLLVYDQEDLFKIDSNNQRYIEAGTNADLLIYVDSNNNKYLPLFTDFENITKWYTIDEKKINIIDLSIHVGFEFVRFDTFYSGIIINPGSLNWIMNREQIIEYAINENIVFN